MAQNLWNIKNIVLECLKLGVRFCDVHAQNLSATAKSGYMWGNLYRETISDGGKLI